MSSPSRRAGPGPAGVGADEAWGAPGANARGAASGDPVILDRLCGVESLWDGDFEDQGNAASVRLGGAFGGFFEDLPLLIVREACGSLGIRPRYAAQIKSWVAVRI